MAELSIILYLEYNSNKHAFQRYLYCTCIDHEYNQVFSLVKYSIYLSYLWCCLCITAGAIVFVIRRCYGKKRLQQTNSTQTVAHLPKFNYSLSYYYKSNKHAMQMQHCMYLYRVATSRFIVHSACMNTEAITYIHALSMHHHYTPSVQSI